MIAAAALAKAYGPTPALAGVSLEIPQGEIYALLGRNGAGKTTLLNILTTLTRPDGGAARVAGFDVVADPLAVRQRIGVTFQEPLAERLLRGRDVLELQGELYGLPAVERRARIAELARLLELDELLERPVRSCSGGTARRLELARSLVPRPRVLFLDEPTAGLDLPSRERFWRLLQQLRDADGLTVLLTTHAMDEAEAIAERVGILEGGALAVEGAPEALVAAVTGETVTVAGAGAAEPFLAALRAQPWVVSAEVGEAAGATRLRARLPGAGAAGSPQTEVVVCLQGAAGARLKAIIELGERHGFAVADMRLHRPGLAEVFHAHTGRRYPQNGDDAR
jgi:ABC-2 type transport system ATP-binding protein